MSIRRIVATITTTAVAVAGLALGSAAQAEYPERPITMIVGFSAGGGTDTLARIIAKNLEDKYGTQVIVENRPGSDGTIAAALVAEAPADGYTLGVVTNGHTISPNLYDLPYDPIADFTPISVIASQPNLLILNKRVEANTVQEFIDHVKANPGKVNYGSSGSGTSPRWVMEQLKQMGGLDMVHIPYKGSSPALLAVLNGDIDALFAAVSSAKKHVDADTVKAVGISSPERNPAVPDIPTVAETLPGFVGATWYGIIARAGIPDDIAEKLNADIVEIIQSPEVSKTLTDRGLTVEGNSLEEFRAYMAEDIARWKTVAAKLGDK